MKIKYLKLKHWMLITLGGLLGFNMASCDIEAAEEYGCPMADYHVKGTVTNAEGQPIQGLAGGLGEETTDSQGKYSVTINGAFPREPYQLDFCDVDSEQNGSYHDTTVTITTADVSLSGGDGHWYEGEGTITKDVVMRRADK